MKQFAMTAAAAAAVMMMNPAFAADAAYEADLCVIGAGASGTAAAWAAAEKGMKVITLEKSGLPGGTGKYSEGIFAVESAMQRNWNYGLTKDEAFMKIMNYGHWRGNARMVRAFVDRSADTIDWMIKNGVKFEKLFSNYPNGLYTWHIYEGRGAGWINLFIDKYKTGQRYRQAAASLAVAQGRTVLQRRNHARMAVCRQRPGTHRRNDVRGL